MHMKERISAVRASVVDGIAITPRYRERQLANLHAGLFASRSSLIEILAEQTAITAQEADAQWLLTTKAIQTYHLSVNPEKCLNEEYLVAQGKDNKARRIPYGCAYIIPSPKDPLYSILVPIGAAIAAGNCVVVEFQQTLSNTDSAVRKLLLDCLSDQTFAIVDSFPFSSDFRTRYCIELDAHETMDGTITTSKKICTEANRVAAIVDRSANINSAAKECIKARFGFGGRSAYAPDLVLVNEFCVERFCSAATESALQYFSAGITNKVHVNRNGSNLRTHERVDGELRDKLEKSSASILVTGDKGTIALLKDRTDKLATQKLDFPLLLIVPISSMDDAINLLSQEKIALRANYLFCAPAAAKYLGQFISSSITTVNHIPNELLIGPPAPSGHAVSIQPRYTTEMFSIAQPQVIQVSSLSSNLTALLSKGSAVQDKKRAEEALNVEITRVKEAFGPPVGFFEQGLLFSLSCILISVTTVGVLAFKYVAPVVLARLREF